MKQQVAQERCEIVSPETTMEAFPQPLRKYIEAIGLEAFLKLSQATGGKTIYVPSEDGIRKYLIRQDIQDKYHHGCSLQKLAEEYQLDIKTIRKYVGLK